MKEEIKKLQEKAREELEKELDKHLYTCADYEISSDKIDNEILKTTGESIKKEILERQNTLIEQTYKQAEEDVKEKIIGEIFFELQKEKNRTIRPQKGEVQSFGEIATRRAIDYIQNYLLTIYKVDLENYIGKNLTNKQ